MLKARRAALPQVDRLRYSTQITAHICDLPAYRDSGTVMLYMALPHEVQTAALIAHARDHDKRVLIPRVTPEGLLAMVCPAKDSHFLRGPYGILEPPDTSAVVSPAEIDLVLVPGIGFDAQGGRLGYGGGCYDRFLRLLPARAHFCGLAFHIQILPSIPQLPHDIRMPEVVTEQGTYACRPVRPPVADIPANEAG